MAKPAHDTLGAARELEAKGTPPDQAGAIVNTIQRSKGDLVTSDHFETRIAEMRAYIDKGFAAQESKLYRALRLQGAAIVGVLTGLIGLVAGLQTILGRG